MGKTRARNSARRPETTSPAMDIILARTFLMVAETGSFIDASTKMHVTQSTVSARIKGLEQLLGRPLFARSKTGAALTPAGVHFQKHALALIRVWQHAQLEVGLSVQHRDHLSVGAPTCLWDGLLLPWVAWLRTNIPDIAVSASAGTAAEITQRLVEGTLDLAVLYRPTQPPGLIIEHLFDEEFIHVTSGAAANRRTGGDYIFIDWGADFQLDHAAAFPDRVQAGLNLDIGSIGLDYVLKNASSAYFPRRLVTAHIASGVLRATARARKFVYPVYMAYPEARDIDAYAPILAGLRAKAGAGA
jgi:LysR family transcriptional regulator, flagellar master operon regulator